MPKKETKAWLITLIIIDIISITAFIFLFNFINNQTLDTINKEDQIKSEVKQEEIRVVKKTDIADSKIYQEKLLNYVIPSGGTVDFIKTIESLVSSSSLKSDIQSVNNISYDKGSSLNMELLSINMNVLGEWKNIQFFIKMLEKYPLKIDIKRINLHQFSSYVINGREVPEWSASIEFTVVKILDAK